MKKIKVLLTAVTLRPNIEEIGICYIASVLREEGYEVKLLTYYDGNEHFYDEVFNFGPDIVGMSVYTATKNICYDVCRKIRAGLPKVGICFGGVAPSLYTTEMLEETDVVDYIVRGEGEITFKELLSCLEEGLDLKNVNGLAYRDQGNIVITPNRQLIKDFNRLPFPSRDLLKQNDIRIATMATSRGCTHNCSFCTSPIYWKTNDCRWRGRDPKRVVDEIEYIVTNYQCDTFKFIENSFEDPNPDMSRLYDIVNEIINRKIEIYYFIECRAGIYKKMTPELIQLLKNSGLVKVNIGIEAANVYDLKTYNKATTVEENYEVVRFFKNHDINVQMGFINFNPYSCFDGLRQNIAFFKEFYDFQAFQQNSILVICKGTEIYEKLKTDGLLKLKTFDDFYGYEYIDKRIGVLADFIENYFKPLMDKYLYALAYFCFQTKDIAQIFRRHFSGEQHQEACNIISSLVAYYDNILLEFSASRWYERLLDLAESEWNYIAAVEIMNEELNEEKIKRIFNEMLRVRNSMFKKMVVLNRQYFNYINWV